MNNTLPNYNNVYGHVTTNKGTNLLNGAVAGSIEQVIETVKMLSESLKKIGVEHSFEIYEDDIVKIIDG